MHAFDRILENVDMDRRRASPSPASAEIDVRKIIEAASRQTVINDRLIDKSNLARRSEQSQRMVQTDLVIKRPSLSRI